jgi:hypothetical protein
MAIGTIRDGRHVKAHLLRGLFFHGQIQILTRGRFFSPPLMGWRVSGLVSWRSQKETGGYQPFGS